MNLLLSLFFQLQTQLPSVPQAVDSLERSNIKSFFAQLKTMTLDQIVDAAVRGLVGAVIRVALAVLIFYIGRWIIRHVIRFFQRLFYPPEGGSFPDYLPLVDAARGDDVPALYRRDQFPGHRHHVVHCPVRLGRVGRRHGSLGDFAKLCRRSAGVVAQAVSGGGLHRSAGAGRYRAGHYPVYHSTRHPGQQDHPAAQRRHVHRHHQQLFASDPPKGRLDLRHSLRRRLRPGQGSAYPPLGGRSAGAQRPSVPHRTGFLGRLLGQYLRSGLGSRGKSIGTCFST